MEYSKIAHHDHNVRWTNVWWSIMDGLFKNLWEITTSDTFLQMIQRYQSYLPKCPNNIQLSTHYQHIKNQYITLAYLIILDKNISQAHPILGWEYKRMTEKIIPQIHEKFWTTFDYRSERMVNLCYRLENNQKIKHDNDYAKLLNRINGDNTFLMDTLNEFIVTDILQMQHQSAKLFIASSMDDRLLWIDGIYRNETQKKIKIMDYTIIRKSLDNKIENLSNIITFQHKSRNLHDSEFAQILRKDHKLLSDYKLEASIIQINRDSFYEFILPWYIDYYLNFWDEEQFRNTIANTTFYTEHIITSCTSP